MATYVPPPAVMAAGKSSIGGLFRSYVPVEPGRVAVVDGERSLTYAELDARSNRLAQVMIGLGLERGDRLALLARNCLEYIEIEMAAAKAGIILAALNWRLGDRELRHCVELVEPKALIVQPDLAPAIDRLDLAARPRIVIGEDYENRINAAPDRFPDVAIDPEDGLVILYTSGTTGLPKGALISHRAMIARALCMAAEIAYPIGDHFIAWAPLYHMASTDASLATLLRGGTVHVVDGYLPDRIIDIIEQVSVHFLVLMPGMVRQFTEALQARQAKVKPVGVCGAMADLVPRQDIADVTRYLNAPRTVGLPGGCDRGVGSVAGVRGRVVLQGGSAPSDRAAG